VAWKSEECRTVLFAVGGGEVSWVGLGVRLNIVAACARDVAAVVLCVEGGGVIDDAAGGGGELYLLRDEEVSE
jgi:hypothetical protein